MKMNENDKELNKSISKDDENPNSDDNNLDDVCKEVDDQLKEIANLKEQRESLEEKAKKIKFMQLCLNKKEKDLDKREEDLQEEIDNFNIKKEEFLEEKKNIRKKYQEYAERSINDIEERNKELSKKLNDLMNVKRENESLKIDIEHYKNQIERLSSDITSLNTQLNEYKSYKELSQIPNLKQKLDKLEELDRENKILKKENKLLKESNSEIDEKDDEIETLKNMNDILRTRLDRSNSNIKYLKSIEKSKGLGVDSSQEEFEEIIELQMLEDEQSVGYNYKGDDKFVDDFIEYCKDAGFIYKPNLVRSFLASIKSSKMTILKGYSGTGKSSLPILFAKYLNAECEVVPVQPNWRTKQDIIGFYNYFTNKFIPTDLTKTLIRANVSKDRIFFVVLDEMNLARVEYYFSEFNSKLWADKDKRKIQLFEGNANYSGHVEHYIEDNKIYIPDNVFFIGTINEDDSVSPISDKIFDRAQVVDFMELPSYSYRGKLDDVPENNEKKFTRYSSFIGKQINEKNKKSNCMDIVDKVNKSVKDKFGKVIGYRSLSQIEDFIIYFESSGGNDIDALDIQLVSKFVPKFNLVYSEEQIMQLEQLKDEIKELFKQEFKCNENKLNNLQIIQKIDHIIKECNE